MSRATLDAKIILSDKRKSVRELTFHAVSKQISPGLSKSLVRFSTPAELKGAGFLQVQKSDADDDRHLFLPELKRSRRISGNLRNTAFMGTDFSFSDLDRRDLREGTATPLDDKTAGGLPCSNIKVTPRRNNSESRNDEPERASRPFDRDRDGFVIAEGAGILLLEEREAALARGATIHAEVIGYGATADAHHITQPSEGGEGGHRAMQIALDDAGVIPSAVDYVNAHGTSTGSGDVAELQGLLALFGDALRRIPISSTKSMTGHLLGAAGAVEAALCVLALRDQMVPPTINLDHPVEEASGLDLVPHRARPHALNVVLSNSFGFGGTNVALVFKKHN